TVVTAGYGTFASSGHVIDSDYLTAARTPEGGLVLAYAPTPRTFTVDMTKLASPAVARWWDPSRGTFTAIAGSPFANSGARAFTSPGPNGDGDGDWLLVLEAQTVPVDTHAPSVPAGLAASGVTSSQATLSWNASTDDFAVAGYRLYRDGVLLRTLFTTSWTD